MLQKIAKRITNNFGLKILAVVFAVVIWLIVVNIEDPEKTKVYSIPVTIENADYLTSMGKTYEIINNTDTVTFTITAKRSIMENLSISDFTAVADMKMLDENDMTFLPVSITVSRYANQVEVSKKTKEIEISVENLVTQKFDIQVTTTGTPAVNCTVQGTSAEPKRVTVSGPESVVSSIESAQAVIDVTDAATDLNTTEKIELLDAEGLPVSQERLSLNRTKVSVEVLISMEKSIPIEIKTSGSPAEGYENTNITTSVSDVKVTGDSEILSGMKSLTIESSRLNLTGKKEDFQITLQLSDHLPKGVILAPQQTNELVVSITIIGKVTKTFAMPVENITITNLNSAFDLTFHSTQISVNLQGFAEDLDKISASALRGTLDASGLTAGTHMVEIKLEGDYRLTTPVEAGVTISAKNQDTGSNNTDDAPGGGGSNASDNNESASDNTSEGSDTEP